MGKKVWMSTFKNISNSSSRFHFLIKKFSTQNVIKILSRLNEYKP